MNAPAIHHLCLHSEWFAAMAATASTPKKDSLAQLLALNLEVAANIEKVEPVTGPGVAKNYPDAKQLVTEDCIQPQHTA